MAHLFAENFCGLERVGNARDKVTNDRVTTLSSSRLSNSIAVDLKRLIIQFRTPIVRLIKESLILLLKMPKLISLVRLKARVQLTFSPEEGAIPQECLQFLATLLLGRFAQHNIRTKEVLLTDEELHNELDDFTDIGCHRRVVAVHLIDDCLEQMCHTLQHLIL
jgi:hypothetical protein